MLKDFFQKNIETMNDLRTEQFKVSEYLQKGKYKMKQKYFAKGKKHYDFDINSQEYFHEELQDVAFESSEVQEMFNNYLIKALQEPIQFNNKIPNSIESLPARKNPSETRLNLARFFRNRQSDLEYEKYLIMQRLYNLNGQEQIGMVTSRLNLIDKQIQMSLNRESRLACEDYYEESYTMGGKPVPINENGQPIYKYLDEEDCWYSNVARDDILVYSRYLLFRRDVLFKYYYPLLSQVKSIVSTQGLDLLILNEQQLSTYQQNITRNTVNRAKSLLSLVQKHLEEISPGNLIEKQNINSFVFNIYGVEEGQKPLNLPLYPCILSELLQNYQSILDVFFKGVSVKQGKDLISLMPKLNSFCSIVFKYQNKEILEGKQEIRLGLEDDVDVRKQLYTMLEQAWVKKQVKMDFERFDYKLKIQPIDWPTDTITLNQKRQQAHTQNHTIKTDTSLQELIKLVALTDYHVFRKHMKSRSELIVHRAKDKYFHMEFINHCNMKSDEELTLEQLGDFFRIKFNEDSQDIHNILKPNAATFLEIILKKHLITNPVEIQIGETLRCIKIREERTKLMGILNGMRCYHRNLALDLRVISGQKFSFQMDDQFLINSNKQAVESFEKSIKETQTYFSKVSGDSQIKLGEEDFIMHQAHQKSKMYKKDIVQCKFYSQAIPHVIVSFGKRKKYKIIYQIVQDDLKQIESRILQNLTVFINRYQRYLKLKSLPEIVDRAELLSQAYSFELEFAYQKFKLIELYYYIYQNTIQPINAFKISQIIVELIYKNPSIDFDESSFIQSYQASIQTIREETKIISLLIQQIEMLEEEKCKVFHDKFARMINIPLTLQAYLYGDIQKKAKTQNKLVRMNSMSSKMSKESKNVEQKKIADMRSQIKEEFEENSDSEDSFDIEAYDQYLLKKDMDAIFDDMVVADQHGNPKEGAPVNTVAIENAVVNPRFEGGPHIKIKILPEVLISSEKKQRLLDFSQYLHVLGNFHYVFESLVNEFIGRYGFISQIYQLNFGCILREQIYKGCLIPEGLPAMWLQFETNDPYQQTVIKCMRYFEEMMSASLEPPSNVQLAIPSTHDKHQEKLPPYGSLQCFDYYSLLCLVTLKKPKNSFRYRQHNLGINYLELLQLQDQVWKFQLHRRELISAYKNIAKHCESVVDLFGMMYTNSGQSEVFLASQELKQYNLEMFKHAVFNESLEELRDFIECERADLQLFQTVVDGAKLRLEDLLIMKHDIEKNFRNGRIKWQQIISRKDSRVIKTLKNRILGLLSIKSNQILKNCSFLRIKAPLKTAFQSKVKELNDFNHDNSLDLAKERITPFGLCILTNKYKRKLQLKCIQAYTRDLLQTNNNLRVLHDCCNATSKLKSYSFSLPFLSKILIIPTTNPEIDAKVYYDQLKNKNQIQFNQKVVSESKIIQPFYIYTQDQLFEEFGADQTFIVDQNLKDFNVNLSMSDLLPPSQNKDLIFKWTFNIPEGRIDGTEKETLKHLMEVARVATGAVGQSDYANGDFHLGSPRRNKLLTLQEHYESLVEYIEANVMMISLQMEDDVLDSLQKFIQQRVPFEERFKMQDENSIRQTIDNIQNSDLKTIYNYIINYAQVKEDIKNKVEERNYLEKKEHWAVHDQISDFIVSKVQGFGLIRQSFLPLYQELQSLQEIKNFELKHYFKQKSLNMYKYLYLAFWETYHNQINEKESDFYEYMNKCLSWISDCHQLQRYCLEDDENNRVDINHQVIDLDQKEKERFHLGLYSKQSSTLVNRSKHLAVIPALRHQHFIYNQICKPSLNQLNSFSKYNYSFHSTGNIVLKAVGQHNRFKIFARVRYYFEKAANFLKAKPPQFNLLEKEISKQAYLDVHSAKKLLMMATVAFVGKIHFPTNAKKFKQIFMELKEVNQINTHCIYDRLQSYKNQNKIQFSKSEMALIGKNEGNDDLEFNSIIKEVISLKLMKEEFKFRVLSQSMKLLRNQRLPKTQPKRIINTSLIPRVHLISSYSSPLITDRKTYISQQYKLAFLQAFINRFRNKVSRVDLLSSGYGFVITVPDLQDCVNYMNKLLFTFTEKEFKSRLQTFSQYYEILLETINEKNVVINQQVSIIKHLQHRVNNVLEAQYLGKVTKLLHEKTLVQDKLLTVQNHINGLEDRVRKTVQIQYDQKIQNLTRQNQTLKDKFTQFKELFVILTKDATKNNFLNITNSFRQKIGEILNKKIDLAASFEQQKETPINGNTLRAKEEDNEDKYKRDNQQKYTKDNQEQQTYLTQDLQKCKMGEDIIHDPYYTTKLINKMRVFNLFRMGSKRLKFDQEQSKQGQQLTQLQQIQDAVVSQSERELLLRNQMTRVQEELSKKCVELDKLKHQCENLENQKTKLKIIMMSKDKKIEQKDREAEEWKKKVEEKQIVAIFSGVEKDKSDELPKIANLRVQKKYKAKIEKSAFVTNIQQISNSNTLSLYERFELSNKDVSWRQKCEQLYIQNKKLTEILDKFQTSIPNTPKREGQSLNLRNKRNFESISESNGSQKDQKRFSNASFKFNIVKQSTSFLI